MTKIPEELRKLKQWIVWKMVLRGTEQTKIPFQVNGATASSTDPSTWGECWEAERAAPNFSGIGFVFSQDDPYCGIDFDNCRVPETGEIAAWARVWIKKLDSYSEISPSNTGVKVWVKGKVPDTSGKKVFVEEAPAVEGKRPAVEMYDHARYFCVTGRRLANLQETPQERQEVINALFKYYFSEKSTQSGANDSKSSRLSVVERARKYVDTIPGAVSGSGGHNDTFKVACILILGFGLTKAEAGVLLLEYNRRCEPQWKEKELQHKLDSADKQGGERGYLRDKNESELKAAKIPDYRQTTSRPANSSPDPSLTTLESATKRYLDKISLHSDPLLSVGMPQVDYAIGGGVEAGEMVIVAARPGHGKSAFGLQCLDIAARSGIPCAIVSEEMSSIALGKRTVQYATATAEQYWLSSMSQVREEMDAHFAKRAPCYIIEGCGSSERASIALKKLSSEKGIKIAAIDYAQLLGSAGKNRYEQITQTSITLRQLASSTGLTLFVMCQLSRAIMGRDKFIPHLEDLKDSGQLEQDADVVLFLVWPYRLDTKKNPTFYEVWIGKNRNRPINAPEVDCQFDPSRQRITASRQSEPDNLLYADKWQR